MFSRDKHSSLSLESLYNQALNVKVRLKPTLSGSPKKLRSYPKILELDGKAYRG